MVSGKEEPNGGVFNVFMVMLVLFVLFLMGLFGWWISNLVGDPAHVPTGDIAQVRLWEALAHQTIQVGTGPGSTPETGFQARLSALKDDEQACSLLAQDKYYGYTLVPRDILRFERSQCNGNP